MVDQWAWTNLQGISHPSTMVVLCHDGFFCGYHGVQWGALRKKNMCLLPRSVKGSQHPSCEYQWTFLNNPSFCMSSNLALTRRLLLLRNIRQDLPRNVELFYTGYTCIYIWYMIYIYIYSCICIFSINCTQWSQWFIWFMRLCICSYVPDAGTAII